MGSIVCILVDELLFMSQCFLDPVTSIGNVLIDGLMKKLYDKEYDEDGCHGAMGTLNNELLQYLIDKDSFIAKPPPKSTGREV